MSLDFGREKEIRGHLNQRGEKDMHPQRKMAYEKTGPVRGLTEGTGVYKTGKSLPSFEKTKALMPRMRNLPRCCWVGLKGVSLAG